jgi:hypothetical protein
MADSENITNLDRPPAGWFALDVMQKETGGRDWVALMVDTHPDTARQAWVRIPGKHRTKDAAWETLENMIATRH